MGLKVTRVLYTQKVPTVLKVEYAFGTHKIEQAYRVKSRPWPPHTFGFSFLAIGVNRDTFESTLRFDTQCRTVLKS
jgi:hypothetical protein